MDINQMIEFLETDKLNFTFTSNGLRYFSPKGGDGEETIDLRELNNNYKNPMVELLIKETMNFLETGSHRMILDLNNFTTFQQMVFNAVGSIEAGSICTYKELADKLGKPGAARAVGGAVAKNPVSYFIPTHRLLPQKGIGECISGAGYLREKLLIHEGHDIERLRGDKTLLK